MFSRCTLCAAFVTAIAFGQPSWVPRLPPSSPPAGGPFPATLRSGGSGALDFSGQLKIPFSVPTLPPGPFTNIQAIILQPPGSACPATLTAAFYVAIQ